MRSNIGIAILSALAMSAMPTINNINIPGESLFRREHSRSRDGTRSNRRYFHKVIQMEQVYRDHTNGIQWVDRWAEVNRPMRRAERKGVTGVPRGFGDKNAIRF